MLGIIDLPTYLLGLLLIVLLPGPNSVYVLSVAARRGTRDGYRAACGVFAGDAVLMTLAAGGIASLLRAEPMLFNLVKWAGAIYLTWLAIGLLRGAWRTRRRAAQSETAEGVEAVEEVLNEAVVDAAPPRGAVEKPFRRAFVVSLLNPKAILFFVSFFVQFVDPTYAYPALSFLALGAWAQLFSFTYLSVLIFGGAYLAATFRRRQRTKAALSAGVGAAFLAFAVKLAATQA
ncbi:leucine efflux protein LeuE [Ornithinimicrobium sp. Y1694]|uniref:leucine efflux protein LeuE n=1 Tax=Ornithinimicrobium sp. Y1694 TaxID=3418590 RepID=UPI003CEC4A32